MSDDNVADVMDSCRSERDLSDIQQRRQRAQDWSAKLADGLHSTEHQLQSQVLYYLSQMCNGNTSVGDLMLLRLDNMCKCIFLFNAEKVLFDY
jgi:hypothetical protein